MVAPERRPRGCDGLLPLPVPAPGRRVPDNNEHCEPPGLPGFRVPGISGWELALPVPRGARAEHTARPPGNRADSPHRLAFGSTPRLPRPRDLVPVPTPPTPLVRKPNFVFGPPGSSAGVAVEKLPRRVSAPSLNLPICEQGQVLLAEPRSGLMGAWLGEGTMGNARQSQRCPPFGHHRAGGVQRWCPDHKGPKAAPEPSPPSLPFPHPTLEGA